MTPAAEWKAYWPVVLAAAAGFSIHSVATSAIGLFMPSIGQEMGWGRAQIALGLTIAAFLTVPLSPFVGAAIDRWGPRRLALPGVIFTGLAIASFSMAHSFGQWIALWVVYALISLGVKATIWTTAVSNAFAQARGVALAVAMSGMDFTQIVVPPLVYWLIVSFGWRHAYIWLGLGWALPVFLATALCLIDVRRAGQGIAFARTPSVPSQANVAGLSVREALRSGPLWRIGLSTLITMLLGTAAVVHQVPILVAAGVTTERAALLASLSGIAALAGKFIMGALMDRTHAARISGMILALSGLGFALLLEPLRAPATIVLAMLIIGFAGGAKLQITAYLTGQYGGLLNFGKIFGVMHGLTVLGAGLGPFLAGWAFDRTHSYDTVLMLGVPGSLICGLLIFGLKPHSNDRPAPRSPEVAAS